ncbi:beta-ketoacyl-ACP synthase II [Pontiella sulfatireligans]|uniref:3-oxoacyl-[acyl-carrier-protein] synthase 2 n=1 Tax=Pontiella sulfatireligans TaxID=2750658 RepID=A0A6C2UMN7_9BACT|nr:beta-ketoacyl-ACP synthase II [Pontiella sulfatireligans]VGO20574.1 3-oxoacyl-[acyl-carrier-protein] synthase 2 [Pontiella sulfatireligans]
MSREVVVTGLGVVSPITSELNSFWEGIKNGRSGISRVEAMTDIDQYPSQVGGEIRDLDIEKFIDRKTARKMDPFSTWGLCAAMMAVEDAGLVSEELDLQRVGVIASSGIGGMQIMQNECLKAYEKGPRRISPQLIPQMITNILSGYISIEYGFKGPNFCITSACASGTHSIGEAMRIIQYGDADVMVAGGSEASIAMLGVGGFSALRATSRRNDDPEGASRPFDKERDGFVMSEGAGILVLEEKEHALKRGATIYCEAAGYGRTGDAYHITAPNAEADEAARGIALAIADAGLKPEDVDYINAHGTSTPLNDKGETLAIKKALGEEIAYKVAVSSTKSMTGHMLGAAGGVEAAICALAIRDSIAPPTINYTTPDPDCDLDYVPNTAREMNIDVALSNSLGFGGHNATLCFKKIK